VNCFHDESPIFHWQGVMNHSAGKIIHQANAWSRLSLQTLAGVGGFARAQWDDLRHAAAVIGTVLGTSVRPRTWARGVRKAFGRQVLAVGVEPVGFVCAVGIFVGISVVVQLTFWIGEVGQSQLLGPLLVAVVARELGPMLINLVVIVRTGSAMTTELGVLKINGEVGALEARGGDPFLHLVMPRVLGMAVSTFCLTIIFILVAFASGFAFAAWMGHGSRDLALFANTLCSAVQPKDILNILAKCILPALYASASCCIGGLGVGKSVTDIPEATERALTRSVAGLFVICAVVSLLTYL
jgi:phospholipid/cholesterol/gamma-HCH transport system permease protein